MQLESDMLVRFVIDFNIPKLNNYKLKDLVEGGAGPPIGPRAHPSTKDYTKMRQNKRSTCSIEQYCYRQPYIGLIGATNWSLDHCIQVPQSYPHSTWHPIGCYYSKYYDSICYLTPYDTKDPPGDLFISWCIILPTTFKYGRFVQPHFTRGLRNKSFIN